MRARNVGIQRWTSGSKFHSMQCWSNLGRFSKWSTTSNVNYDIMNCSTGIWCFTFILGVCKVGIQFSSPWSDKIFSKCCGTQDAIMTLWITALESSVELWGEGLQCWNPMLNLKIRVPTNTTLKWFDFFLKLEQRLK